MAESSFNPAVSVSMMCVSTCEFHFKRFQIRALKHETILNMDFISEDGMDLRLKRRFTWSLRSIIRQMSPFPLLWINTTLIFIGRNESI